MEAIYNFVWVTERRKLNAEEKGGGGGEGEEKGGGEGEEKAALASRRGRGEEDK